MPREDLHEISTPHDDIELGIARVPLRYAVTQPPTGLGDDTGLILYIGGYGSGYDDDYARNLRRHLAETYDCVVVSADYFGSECHQEKDRLPAADFFVKLKEHFGLEMTVPAGTPIQTAARAALDALVERGVRDLPPEIHFINPGGQYNSFGLLPALDCLQVVHRVMADRPINRHRVFLLGSSYGGYIGLLLNKLAPNTFRLIVDNSGFSSSADTLNSIQGVSRLNYRGMRVAVRNQLHFSLSPGRPNSFTPGFAALRELRDPAHYHPGDTVIESFHSALDTFAPIAHKRELAAVLAAARPCTLTVVTEEDLDGHCFKTLEHGMQASLRGLFKRSYERWLPLAGSARDVTDFDMETAMDFDCEELCYHIAFSRSHGVGMTLTRP